MAGDDRSDIIQLVDAIFDAVDAKDWDAAEELFGSPVLVDFTSLDGGTPATISNAQLVDGWRRGLHPRKKSFHLVGHYRVAVDGDTATARVKGYAYNVLDDELGGGMWEVWGRMRSRCAAAPRAGVRTACPSSPGTPGAMTRSGLTNLTDSRI